ncbi:hypothetical protein [Nocardioides sp. Soil805]|uniref:hypothetical protein n=1 Tax=Nocardioides sp. Soil805 TaxID=1736416 RepID=UPI000703AB30|nr:hypothetical protein [Nocardioides sp. Soil805]KRF35193.1 hypothetical protein ASG94_13870 [Nocardioides sp. Soil805]
MTEQFPPPGPTGPQPPPPGGGTPPPYPSYPSPTHAPRAGGPAPGMLGAAHKPGAIPLRPLTLSDIYDAAFRIIRFNPTATVGSAVLVASVAMAIPVVVTAVLTLALDLSLSVDDSGELGGDVSGVLGSMGSLGLGSVLQAVGLILVGGMIAHVVAAAAIGRRLSLEQAWGATRGKRWRLVGLTVVLGLALVLGLVVYGLTWIPVVATADDWRQPVLYGVVSVPVFLAVLVWFWVRVYYLPVPALMLEPVGVLGAIGRGFRLTRGAFWRTFGIALLTVVIAQAAGTALAMPLSFLAQGALLGGVPSEAGVLVLVVSQAVASVVTAAFVAPFTTSVTALQYLDLRMRAEGHDITLMRQAGILGA